MKTRKVDARTHDRWCSICQDCRERLEIGQTVYYFDDGPSAEYCCKQCAEQAMTYRCANECGYETHDRNTLIERSDHYGIYIGRFCERCSDQDELKGIDPDWTHDESYAGESLEEE